MSKGDIKLTFKHMKQSRKDAYILHQLQLLQPTQVLKVKS